MIFEIDCHAFSAELKKVKDLVESRNTMALLTNVLLQAHDNTLTLKATDLDVSVIASTLANVIEEGEVAIDASTLISTVETLHAAKSRDPFDIKLESDQNFWAKLTYKNFSCRIPGVHPADFPEIQGEEGETFVEMPPEDFLELVRKTKFSISKDDARPNLTGAFLRSQDDGKTLSMVTTDGHRLSKMATSQDLKFKEGPLPARLQEGVILPAKGIKLLERNVVVPKTTGDTPNPYTFSFAITQSHIIFKYGMTTYIMRLLDGTFPDYNQILPTSTREATLIEKDKLVFALRSVQIFANEKSNRVKFTFSKDGLKIYASDTETGEGRNLVQIDYDGPDIEVGYNFKYLQQVLDVIDGDTISCLVLDALSPTVLKDAGSDDGLYIVMPMRIS